MAQVDKIDVKHDDTAQQLTFSPLEMGMIYEAVFHANVDEAERCKSYAKDHAFNASHLLYMRTRLKLLEHIVARMEDADWPDFEEDDEIIRNATKIDGISNYID